MIPIKAVDWLLYNHTRVFDEMKSIRFIVRTAILPGLGGVRSSGNGPVENIIEGEFELIYETFLLVITTIESAIANLPSDYHKQVCLYKYEFEFTYPQIRKAFLSSGYERKTSVKTIERTVEEIRLFTQQQLEIYRIREAAVIKMMRRFGYLKRERKKVS